MRCLQMAFIGSTVNIDFKDDHFVRCILLSNGIPDSNCIEASISSFKKEL